MANEGHNSSMSLGDNYGVDLPAQDFDTTSRDPWFQFDNLDLTYVSEGQPTMRRFGGIPGMTPGGNLIGRGW
jgi:hypothetical protein